MNTLVEYLYRDAGNFKAYGEFVFHGPPGPDQLKRLQAALIGGEWILVAEVGLPPLAPWMRGESVYDDTLDHTYHELIWPPQPTTRVPHPPHTTFEAFVEQVEQRNRVAPPQVGL